MNRYENVRVESRIETFDNWYDAFRWLETSLDDFKSDGGWVIEEASVALINGRWRSGYQVSQAQGNLDFEKVIEEEKLGEI